MVRQEEHALMKADAPTHTVLNDKAQHRRILIVGDIHGCADEFRDLLAAHHREDDVLILAGDLVNKGPKSIEVIRLARELNAYAVVGNHELASLRGHNERGGGSNPTAALRYAWTDDLNAADVEYIRGLPYTISLPLHNAIVVHAGLVPEVPLEQQDLNHLVCMRNLQQSPYQAFEGEPQGSEAWASLYRGPQFVYFGHDAKRRLQIEAHAMGLDTGVVYGGQLTAAIVELGKPTRTVSVPARVVHVQPSSAGTSKGAPKGVRSGESTPHNSSMATSLVITIVLFATIGLRVWRRHKL